MGHFLRTETPARNWPSGCSRLQQRGQRFYSPPLGRWLSNDPIGISGGLNQYVFCGNSPVNARDPLGLVVSHMGDCSVFDIANFNASMSSLAQNGGPVGAALVNAANSQDTDVHVYWGDAGVGSFDVLPIGFSMVDLNRNNSLFFSLEQELLERMLGEGRGHGEVVLAHELGHVLTGIVDPFVTDLIENPVRMALGENPRENYDDQPVSWGRQDMPGGQSISEAILNQFMNRYGGARE